MLRTVRIKQVIPALFLWLFPLVMVSQQISAPEPQAGIISGTVTDSEGGVIPGATVTVDGPSPSDRRAATADGDGFFVVRDLHPAIPYHVLATAKGFADWSSPEVVLKAGQELDLVDVKLKISVVQTSVTAVSVEQMALEQVKTAEKQRVLGIIPNFYVAYDPNTVPLTSKLKFQLAFKASTDVATIAATAFLAGINQAADRPAYQQGAKGYGQRFGAVYADGLTDIFIGGALLPSVLHQDPRYFYQGTGTTKSRALHAMSSPFRARGDNGKWQFNYSSIIGDLASGALSNLYYPTTDRGPSLVFTTALTVTGGRMANALAQEFILRKFTSHAPDPSTEP